MCPSYRRLPRLYFGLLIFYARGASGRFSSFLAVSLHRLSLHFATTIARKTHCRNREFFFTKNRICRSLTRLPLFSNRFVRRFVSSFPQVIYVVALTAACMVNAVNLLSTITALIGRQIFTPEGKWSPLSFMKLTHEVRNEVSLKRPVDFLQGFLFDGAATWHEVFTPSL